MMLEHHVHKQTCNLLRSGTIFAWSKVSHVGESVYCGKMVLHAQGSLARQDNRMRQDSSQECTSYTELTASG